jgi:hypothetical protein
VRSPPTTQTAAAHHAAAQHDRKVAAQHAQLISGIPDACSLHCRAPPLSIAAATTMILGAYVLRTAGAMADRCRLSCPDTDAHYKTTGHGFHLDGKFLSYSISYTSCAHVVAWIFAFEMDGNIPFCLK